MAMVVQTDQDASGPEMLTASYTAFQLLADRLMMPDAERVAILGLSAENWSALCTGRAKLSDLATPSLLRRLAYVLPLMRRAASNRAAAAEPAFAHALAGERLH